MRISPHLAALATLAALVSCTTPTDTGQRSRFDGVWRGPAVRLRAPVDAQVCTALQFSARIGVRNGIARFRFGPLFHETPVKADGSIESLAGPTALVGTFADNAFNGTITAGRDCNYGLNLQREAAARPPAAAPTAAAAGAPTGAATGAAAGAPAPR